ncbi:hypothetical protein NECID01_2081 [Nematocida sp. AWRm77]|nr:hypothetical protein NECID01_2081 [Nematocida sp. AWRm77]
MQPHVLLAREIIYRWGEEIAKEMEEDVVLATATDPVIAKWGEEINALIPELKIKNTCSKPACIRTCYYCVQILRELKENGGKNLLVNYKSEKLLFVKMKEIRCIPLKRVGIERQIIDLFEESSEVNIVDCNDYKVFLPPMLFCFFEQVDREYLNPPLLVQMVKYLEFEKKFREGAEVDLKSVLHGLKVSFFIDPVLIEHARLNLFRQNNTGIAQQG